MNTINHVRLCYVMLYYIMLYYIILYVIVVLRYAMLVGTFRASQLMGPLIINLFVLI